MKNVKRTFFLTEAEAKAQREITSNPYIDALSPHYEMEDGSISWGLAGGPSTVDRFHNPISSSQ